jgi:hypothetical protein
VEARASHEICCQLEASKDHLSQECENKSGEIDDLLQASPTVRQTMLRNNMTNQ